MITNRKAQAFVFVFLGTVATGQAQAAEGFTSKVEAQTIANAAGGVKAKAKMNLGGSCGQAKGSSEVKAKTIANAAGGLMSTADMKVGTVGC